jgi:carbon monoxide dehydrogenase subunit G
VRLERTPDGRRLVVSRRIDAPRDVVWGLLCDTERWTDWGPSVRSVDCPVRYVEVGTTGRVRTPLGWVPFEVTSGGDYRWSWDVAGVPATGHRVEASAEGGCEVSFEVPPLAAPYTVVCERALKRIEVLALDRAGGGN